MKTIPKQILMVLTLFSVIALSGCTLYEDIDIQTIDRPESTPVVDPQPWNPQPGDDGNTETGH